MYCDQALVLVKVSHREEEKVKTRLVFFEDHRNQNKL